MRISGPLRLVVLTALNPPAAVGAAIGLGVFMLFRFGLPDLRPPWCRR